MKVAGMSFIFGVRKPLPLRGFPRGRARIKQRVGSFVKVFVRPPEGGVRCFYVTERNNSWWPGPECDEPESA